MKLRRSAGIITCKNVYFATMAVMATLVAVFTITACGHHNPQAPNQQVDHSKSDGGAPPESIGLDAVVKAMEQPNKYQVTLRWKENPKALAWFVSRADRDDSRPLHRVTLGHDKLSFVDDKVQAGESYRYLLTSAGSNGCLIHTTADRLPSELF